MKKEIQSILSKFHPLEDRSPYSLGVGVPSLAPNAENPKSFPELSFPDCVLDNPFSRKDLVSLRFKGSKNGLNVNKELFDIIDTSDFCLEFWFKNLNPEQDRSYVLNAQVGQHPTVSNGFFLDIHNFNFREVLYLGAKNPTRALFFHGIYGWEVKKPAEAGSWNHYAIIRKSGVFHYYCNGQKIPYADIFPSRLYDEHHTHTKFLRLGYWSQDNKTYHVEEKQDFLLFNLRVTQGQTVYPSGSTFEVPKEPLSKLKDTCLLLC